MKLYISAKNYILRLNGNALVCIAFHPLWGVPYSLYFFYLSLYMKANGVTDAQLGILMLAGFAASIFFSIIAAPLVDRMGRKRATFVFDLISSAVPPLIYAISGSFWFSLVAMVLTNANKVMSVAYYLIMVEDSDDDQRIIAFNLFNIITVAAGILIPVAGFFVKLCGIIRAERFFLIFACISMTILIFIRNHFLKETTVGEKLLKNKSGRFSPGAAIRIYSDSYRFLAGHPAALLTVIASIIFYVYYIIGTNNSLYFATYFIDALNLDEASISILGSVYAVGMLIAMVIINPLVQRLNIFINLITGALLNTAGIVMLVIIPSGSLPAAIVSIVVTSVGFGIFKSVLDAALAITTEGKDRAGIYSIVNLLSSILGILTAGLCGILYPLNPKSVYFISIIILFVSITCFTIILLKRGRYGQSKEAC